MSKETTLGCICCIEYLNGQITAREFERNRTEYRNENHNPDALAYAEFEKAIDEATEKARKDKENYVR